MRKRLVTVTGATATIVAVVAGWSLWPVSEPGAPIYPREQPEKPAESLPAPATADMPASRTKADTGAPIVEELAGESRAQAHPDIAADVPPFMVGGDFPPYLAAVADTGSTERDPRGCKRVYAVLAEMAEEARDELWASRVERELGAMLGEHPLGFPVSVGCRATICQVTEIGDLTAITRAAPRRDHQLYWSIFMDSLRSSPVASEFATSRFFSGNFFPHPSRLISGYVFTSLGQATPAEPHDCAPFQPRGSERQQ